jgi:hypothetical protein
MDEWLFFTLLTSLTVTIATLAFISWSNVASAFRLRRQVTGMLDTVLASYVTRPEFEQHVRAFDEWRAEVKKLLTQLRT